MVMGINKAQAEALADGFIGALGGDYSKINEDDYPILERMLLLAGKDFVLAAQANLTADGSIGSGGLMDLSTPLLYKTGDGYTLEIGYPLDSKQVEYYDYVNKGVKGVGGKNAKLAQTFGNYKFRTLKPSRKMLANLEGSLNLAASSIRNDRGARKGISVKRMGIAEAKKASLFAISTKIKRDGIRGTRYFDKALEAIFSDEFIEALEAAVEGDVFMQISKPIQTENE